MTGADDLPLASVIERGERQLIEAWLDRKFDQWEVIGPYLVAHLPSRSTRSRHPASLDGWVEDTAGAMHEWLNRADRFDPSTLRIRCVLAFGELEYLAKRWLRARWADDRQIPEDAYRLVVLPAHVVSVGGVGLVRWA